MKNLKNLGKTLNKLEQKEINGGGFFAFCTSGDLALSQEEGGPCILVGIGSIGVLRNGQCCSC